MTRRYIARISDRDGRQMYRSAAHDTREAAAADAFAARPKARECCTSKAAEIDSAWIETHSDIRSHRRADLPHVEPTPAGPQYVMPGCQQSARQAAAARDAASHGRLSNGQPQFPMLSGLFAPRERPDQLDIEQAIAETQERST